MPNHVRRAFLGQARSQQLPQVGADAGVERGRGGLGTPTQSQASLGVGASFEVDLFGRLAGNTSAAVLDAQGRAALLGATRVAVQAAVAQTYLALRATEREQRVVVDTTAAYRDTLALTERRFDAGVELGKNGWALACCRLWPEDFGEHTAVFGHRPRQPGEPHLDGDEGSG